MYTYTVLKLRVKQVYSAEGLGPGESTAGVT